MSPTPRKDAPLSMRPEAVRARVRIEKMSYDRRDWDNRVDNRFRRRASRQSLSRQQKAALMQQKETEKQVRRRWWRAQIWQLREMAGEQDDMSHEQRLTAWRAVRTRLQSGGVIFEDHDEVLKYVDWLIGAIERDPLLYIHNAGRSRSPSPQQPPRGVKRPRETSSSSLSSLQRGVKRPRETSSSSLSSLQRGVKRPRETSSSSLSSLQQSPAAEESQSPDLEKAEEEDYDEAEEDYDEAEEDYDEAEEELVGLKEEEADVDGPRAEAGADQSDGERDNDEDEDGQEVERGESGDEAEAANGAQAGGGQSPMDTPIPVLQANAATNPMTPQTPSPSRSNASLQRESESPPPANTAKTDHTSVWEKRANRAEERYDRLYERFERVNERLERAMDKNEVLAQENEALRDSQREMQAQVKILNRRLAMAREQGYAVN